MYSYLNFDFEMSDLTELILGNVANANLGNIVLTNTGPLVRLGVQCAIQSLCLEREQAGLLLEGAALDDGTNEAEHGFWWVL